MRINLQARFHLKGYADKHHVLFVRKHLKTRNITKLSQ